MTRLDAMLEVCSYWWIGHSYYKLLKEIFTVALDNEVKGSLNNDIKILKSKLWISPMIRKIFVPVGKDIKIVTPEK